RPLRAIAQRFGGSHAQRDLLDLTLLEAARRSGQEALARALANERLQLRPRSPQTRRLALRVTEVRGGRATAVPLAAASACPATAAAICRCPRPGCRCVDS